MVSFFICHTLADEEPDLIGDFTEVGAPNHYFVQKGVVPQDIQTFLSCFQPYALPRIKGKHDDLKMISPSTVSVRRCFYIMSLLIGRN